MKVKFWERKKRNTKRRGTLHFVIFKWNGRYLGICKETGFVEENEDFNEVKKRLEGGTIALLRAVIKSHQNLEPSLNTSPPLRYAIYYRFARILGLLEFIKDSCKKETIDFYSSFEESIPSLTR